MSAVLLGLSSLVSKGDVCTQLDMIRSFVTRCDMIRVTRCEAMKCDVMHCWSCFIPRYRMDVTKKEATTSECSCLQLDPVHRPLIK